MLLAPVRPEISRSGPGSPVQRDGGQWLKAQGCDGRWACVSSSGQMTFGQPLSFLSTGFPVNTIGTTVSKHHGVDVGSVKEVIRHGAEHVTWHKRNTQ